MPRIKAQKEKQEILDLLSSHFSFWFWKSQLPEEVLFISFWLSLCHGNMGCLTRLASSNAGNDMTSSSKMQPAKLRKRSVRLGSR